MSVSGQTAEGMGPSKKVAKRNAAEKMLELLGFKVPQPQPPKPALKTDEKVQWHLLDVPLSLCLMVSVWIVTPSLVLCYRGRNVVLAVKQLINK